MVHQRRNRLRQRDSGYETRGLVCQLTELEALFEEDRENQATNDPNSSSFGYDVHYTCIVRSDSGSAVDRIGYYEAKLSDAFLAAFGDVINHGNARFSFPLRYLDAASRRVTISDEDDLSEIRLLESGSTRDLQIGQQDQVRESANGIKTVLAIRVKAPDGDAPETAEEISAAIFGTANDSSLIPTASVVAQYASVSHGKLSLIPATGPGIVNGVAEITIDQPVKGARIQAELSSHLLEKTAEALGAPVEEIADRIIYCIPTGSLLQGRDTWTAYTYLFQHQSYFQQSRCTKLSVVVHELGHSFGFRHSGMNNDDYGDETDYMGYAVNFYGVPRKAFNAHKHWLSGWFADRAVWLDPASSLRGGPIGAYLASFVDYRNPSLGDSAVILIRIGNLFLQFNEGKGYNADTPAEARDRVIVAEAAGPGEVSQLLKGIAVGQAFVRPGFSAEGHDLVVTFCDHVVAPYGYAAISIHLEDGVQTSVCGDPDSFGNAGGLDSDEAGDAADPNAGTLVFEDGDSENGGQAKENITIGVVWGFVGILVLVSAYLALRMARERKKKQLQRTANAPAKEFRAPVRVRKCSTDEDSHSSVDRVISGDARTEL